jgi:predicted SnoaL-like aldol condensation-catalyzing enzyme
MFIIYFNSKAFQVAIKRYHQQTTEESMRGRNSYLSMELIKVHLCSHLLFQQAKMTHLELQLYSLDNAKIVDHWDGINSLNMYRVQKKLKFL